LLAPIKETGADDEPAYEYLKRLDREAEDTEAARLLYVAATRAEKRLHLLACPRKTMPPKRSLLACAWPVAEPFYAGLAPPEKDDSPPAQPPAPFLLKRLPKDWQLPPPPPAVAWTPPAEGREEEQIPFDWARETVRHAGTVVHAWLQRFAEDQLKGWDAKRVESMRPHIQAELKRRGVSAAELDRALKLVLKALKNALSDDRGRWLLGPHPFASNEHRLRIRGRSLRIDRYFHSSDGTKWVVDYKTSPQEGGGVEAFLEEQRRRYSPQLDAYADAVGGAKRGLYFPLHSAWREW
jgi:ATP-dependent exoDNAse (exonuclease V) beta subunit